MGGLHAVQGDDVLLVAADDGHCLGAACHDAVRSVVGRCQGRLDGVTPDENVAGVVQVAWYIAARLSGARRGVPEGLHGALQAGGERSRRRRRLCRFGRDELAGEAQGAAVHELRRAAADVRLQRGPDAQQDERERLSPPGRRR